MGIEVPTYPRQVQSQNIIYMYGNLFSWIQLGIRDVFEPRQHDFTLMTRQSGVYVRSIEQAVSVAIRKYRPDDHKKNSEFVKLPQLVKFIFLYVAIKGI